jgi:multidrug efflux pump subunit AcrA (membrane-fusion protein)
MTARTQVDLRELAIRGNGAGQVELAPPRRVVSRYVVPGLLVLGFLSVVAWAARDVYLPRHPVTVVPVYVSMTAIQTAGTPLFNAAGWVEPRPTPIRVAALAPGVVDELLVVEDQEVKQGEPIARLVAEDARLQLEQARAAGALREAEVAEAMAAIDAARTNLEIPAHLELPLAEAEAAVAAMDTELSNLPHQLARAEARLRLAQVNLNVKQQAKNAISGIVVEQARSEFDAAQAEVAELTDRLPVLQLQRKALVRRRDAAAKRLELLTEERRALAEANARLQAARSRLDEAQVAIAEAQLRFDRMTIVAPVGGRVLHLVAQPGSQLAGGPTQSEAWDGNTVVTMYDPNRLQVRADVRFEDLPRTGRDQPVLINSPVLAAPLEGRVLFLTGVANIQKNTLEVKVSIDDPPEVLKPEMLVDVTFLAPESEPTDEEPAEQYRLFVPRPLVEMTESGASVWMADVAEQVARRQQIVLGPMESSSFVEVADGLTAGSRLISSGREQLEDGDRIRITGEEAESDTARDAVDAELTSDQREPSKT